ncbi:CocE/NonD family hydrolase [Actinomadura algeriensis]|uniref:ABC-2 type transport system ATP-binding protein n=1 Tax=Actinomadura algeriensis TaxID=1679523 RepID=A0ABR9JJG0_9ACTN|nr:CocE/NonD family hydrolase [Actinomadura algeriensis]MBE1530682.1 ABC-2 type transport system ATP-binding protein [Actinomadura algeriensis]
MPSKIAALVAGSVLLSAGFAGAPAAAAETPGGRTVEVASFDGTKIVTNFFPARGPGAGERAASVLLGSGFGGRGATDPETGELGYLLDAGYNVVTWNPRGFGSEGQVQIDDPRAEGRDVRALIDWIAKQPEAKLDGRGDPRLGMAGGSYGGAIQLVTAGLDDRVDVIVPGYTYHSLNDALYPNRTIKAGWAFGLCSAGLQNGNEFHPRVSSICWRALTTGEVTKPDETWMREHGPDFLMKKIDIPTLFVQGVTDTLFPVSHAIAGYRTIKANGAPVKMVWTCGGHANCMDAEHDASVDREATLAWFQRHLRGDKSVRTGPEFTYPDNTGVRHSAKAFPPPAAKPARGSGSGTTLFSPADNSGAMFTGGYSHNRIEIPVDAPSGGVLVGAPELTMKYRGRATDATTSVYAQLIDASVPVPGDLPASVIPPLAEGDPQVVNGMVTPVPVTLDGAAHELTIDLEAVAWRLRPGSKLKLQIIPNSAVYNQQRAAGWITVTSATVTVPTTAG